jgi:hypothetical protein
MLFCSSPCQNPPVLWPYIRTSLIWYFSHIRLAAPRRLLILSGIPPCRSECPPPTCDHSCPSAPLPSAPPRKNSTPQAGVSTLLHWSFVRHWSFFRPGVSTLRRWSFLRPSVATLRRRSLIRAEVSPDPVKSFDAPNGGFVGPRVSTFLT